MSDVPMAGGFTFVRYRCVWVSENEMQCVMDRIREIGVLEFSKSNPEGTYSLLDDYTLIWDNEAEVFWKDSDRKVLAGIRVSVVYDQGEESEYNARMGRSTNSASDDSKSSTLSPYMRYAFERALGMKGSEDNRAYRRFG